MNWPASLGFQTCNVRTLKLWSWRCIEKATAVGARIIEAEQQLDQAFAKGWIDPAYLRKQTGTIAMHQGELRAIHLETHLAQRAILTLEQIARYNEFRGYQSANVPTDHRQHNR